MHTASPDGIGCTPSQIREGSMFCPIRGWRIDRVYNKGSTLCASHCRRALLIVASGIIGGPLEGSFFRCFLFPTLAWKDRVDGIRDRTAARIFQSHTMPLYSHNWRCICICTDGLYHRDLTFKSPTVKMEPKGLTQTCSINPRLYQ